MSEVFHLFSDIQIEALLDVELTFFIIMTVQHFLFHFFWTSASSCCFRLAYSRLSCLSLKLKYVSLIYWLAWVSILIAGAFVSCCHCFFISSYFSLLVFIYVGIIERTLSALRWHVNRCMSVLGILAKRKNDHCTVKSMLFYSTNIDCMKLQRYYKKIRMM